MKLKAYTIIELLVVLSISSVIVVFSIMIVLNLGKIFKHGEYILDQQITMVSLKDAIEKDFELAVQRIEVVNNKILIHSFNNSIVYTFDENKVVREITNSSIIQNFNINKVEISSETDECKVIIHLISIYGGNLSIQHRHYPNTFFLESNYLIDEESEY